MKRIISLTLALLMFASLSSCKSNKDEAEMSKNSAADIETSKNSEDEKKEIIYNVGDTAESSLFKCKLSDVSFSEKVSENYLLPQDTDTKNCLVAKSGNTFLCFSIELKYIGTDTRSVSIRFDTTYDSKYEFETFIYTKKVSGYWYPHLECNEMNFVNVSCKPLTSESNLFRVGFELPKQVLNDKNKQLTVTVRLGNEYATYIINI